MVRSKLNKSEHVWGPFTVRSKLNKFDHLGWGRGPLEEALDAILVRMTLLTKENYFLLLTCPHEILIATRTSFCFPSM